MRQRGGEKQCGGNLTPTTNHKNRKHEESIETREDTEIGRG